jgi:flagellar motor switch/type III secretory pathway protein FliN
VNVTPFLLLKRSTTERLAQRANMALARWSDVWNLLPGSALTCTAATDSHRSLAAPSDWHARTLANGGSGWLWLEMGLERSVEQMLFGLRDMDATSDKHLSSSIANSVAQDAFEDLAAGLIGALTGQVSQPSSAGQSVPLPDKLFRAGSGAVLCTVSFAEKTIRLLLPAETIPAPTALEAQSGLSNPASPRAPMSTLHQALAKVPIKLSVEVSQAELTLGYLRTLAVGDVLALPTSVDHPMRVCGPGDVTVCHGHLGTLTGFHAIELIK